MSDGISNDALLNFSWHLNREISRERDAAAEGPRLASPTDGMSLREQRLYLEHQRREDRRLGVDRAADAEYRLIRHLQAVYGESPEAAAINRKSVTAYERLYFPDYVNVG
jgi:hypothetical protein